MSKPDPTFAEAQPLAWSFHRNTSRWAHNAATAAPEKYPAPAKEQPLAPLQRLPPPLPLALSLGETLAARVSCRCFAGTALPLATLGTLLHAAYGVIQRVRFGPLEYLERPLPSGGGLYPLELYVIARAVAGLAAGVWHYTPLHHGLEQLREVALPRPLVTYLFMGQDQAAEAAALMVITAVPGRSLDKYGDRGYRYLLFEAGHALQNAQLAAAALGAGSCALGGFFDSELGALLQLDPATEFPLYAATLGMPAERPRAELRGVADG